MGKSNKSKKLTIAQKPLKYSCLTTNTLFEEQKETDTVITWIIEDYTRLFREACNEVVTQKLNYSWQLILARVENQLKILIGTSDYVTATDIRFRRSNGEVLNSIFKGRTDKFFEAVLDLAHISSPSTELTDGVLIIQCLYNGRPPPEKNISLAPGLRKSIEFQKSDVDNLFNDLKQLYLSARFYDFVLRSLNKSFKVHKFILCRHSSYLAYRITRDPLWTGEDFDVMALPAAMHEVLLYLYSGELRYRNLTWITQFYYIACKLEIESLLDICIHFFKSKLTVDNAVHFLTLALSNYDVHLEEQVALFLHHQPESVKETKAWADATDSFLYYMNEDLTKYMNELERTTENLF